MLGIRELGPCADPELAEIGLVAEEADGPPFGARPVQGALGTAQHFHAVDVDHLGLGGTLVPVVGDDWHFVDVETDGGIADLRADPADRDVILAGAIVRGERHARDHPGDVLVALDVQVLHLAAIQHPDADRYFPRVLLALVGRHHHGVELPLAGGVRSGRGGRIGVRRPGRGASHQGGSQQRTVHHRGRP